MIGLSIDAIGQPRSELPMGLSMALAQNPDALNRFEAMADEKRQAFISGTHAVRSKRDMQSYVQSLVDGNRMT